MNARVLLAVLIVVGLAAPGAATTPDPQIFDISGDANGIQGTSLYTAPASYDPGDLLQVTLETTYVAVPVGDDGIDHQETGLRLSFATTATPGSEGPTTLLYVSGSIGGCRWQFEGRVAGPMSQSWEDGPGKSSVRRETSSCQPMGVSGPMESITGPGLTAAVDPSGLAVLTIPFSGLGTGPARDILKPGAVVADMMAWSFLEPCTLLTGCVQVHIDHSSMPTLPSFVVGEDVPPDVPCTRGCPD